MLLKRKKGKKFTHTQSANNVSSMQLKTLKKTAFLKKNHGDD